MEKRSKQYRAALATVLAVLLCCPFFTSCLTKTASLRSLEELKSISVGDHLLFGTFPQSAPSGTDAADPDRIEWRVLDIRDDKALIITEYLLTPIAYHNLLEGVTWETCSLRRYLNGTFYDTVFSENEKSYISTVINENPGNPLYGTDGGNATEDNVFCLSLAEAQLYFKDCEDRMAGLTDEAIRRGASVSDDSTLENGMKTGWWWLRSPASSSDRAADVDCYGNIDTDFIEGVDYDGDLVFDDTNCVRPAVWVFIPDIVIKRGRNDNAREFRVPLYTDPEKGTVKYPHGRKEK